MPRGGRTAGVALLGRMDILPTAINMGRLNGGDMQVGENRNAVMDTHNRLDRPVTPTSVRNRNAHKKGRMELVRFLD